MYFCKKLPTPTRSKLLDLMHKKHKYNIILGSQSARRQHLLKGLDIDFEVKTIEGLDETYPDTMPVYEVASYLAEQKANAFKPFITADTLLITADTIVAVDGTVYGKPSDAAEAKAMLRTLAGREHEVITGVCISTLEYREAFSVSTKVTFSNLTEDEIEYYIDRYKPFDKAGSYGIQEWIGFVGVESIEGSFYNVMGLPVQRIYKVLKSLDAI